MRRLIRNGLTAASALLAAVAAVAWATTPVVCVRFDDGAIDRSADPVEVATIATVATAPHQLQFGLTRVRLDRGRSLVTLDTYIPRGLTWQQWSTPRADVADARRLVPRLERPPTVDTGFGYRSAVTVAVPFWIPVVAGGVAPAWRLRRWWSRRRRSPAACRRCGYDLRASPGRCPECGAAGDARR